MNTKDYVSYPIALALKNHGFDWECDHVYMRDRQSKDKYEFADWTVDSRNWNKRTRPQTAISAPTLSQAQKWLREVKKWHIIVEPRIWEQQVYDFKLWHYYRGYENANRGFDYLSYESALSAGIAAALGLIEKNGE